MRNFITDIVDFQLSQTGAIANGYPYSIKTFFLEAIIDFKFHFSVRSVTNTTTHTTSYYH